jgi:hypothetical protein
VGGTFLGEYAGLFREFTREKKAESPAKSGLLDLFAGSRGWFERDRGKHKPTKDSSVADCSSDECRSECVFRSGVLNAIVPGCFR